MQVQFAFDETRRGARARRTEGSLLHLFQKRPTSLGKLKTTMSLMYGSNKAGGEKPQLDIGSWPSVLRRARSGELILLDRFPFQHCSSTDL